jgi:UDP-glucose:O-linked fucose beta-1,3-glucosyltransferase
MKSQMNWDQQALEAWLEESARKDEDSMAIQKYSRHDESKIKELSLRMERLTDESAKKRRQLDHETTSTLTAQVCTYVILLALFKGIIILIDMKVSLLHNL